MKPILLLSLPLFLLSCSVKEPVNPARALAVSVAVNDLIYSPGLTNFGNENCNFFFINTGNLGNKDFPYKLEMHLTKKGDLVSASLLSNRGSYESTLFNPGTFLSITNFRYDASANLLSFDFDGKLFRSTVADSVSVKGSFTNLQLPSVACSKTHFSLLEGEASSVSGNAARFYSAISSGSANSSAYQWFFYSNDGYRVVFENKAGLGDLAVGTYSVNSESASPVRIDFRQFAGDVNSAIRRLFLDKDWKAYRVVGTLDVVKQVPDKFNEVQTYGRLSFTAYDDTNRIVYVLKNANFSVSNIL